MTLHYCDIKVEIVVSSMYACAVCLTVYCVSVLLLYFLRRKKKYAVIYFKKQWCQHGQISQPGLIVKKKKLTILLWFKIIDLKMYNV